jgi:hypothetical protein
MGRPRRLRHAAAIAVGLLAGALLVLLVFFRVEPGGERLLVPRFDLGTFVRRLPRHRSWLAPFFLVACALFAFRALVWRVVVPPPRPSYGDAYHATALGALVHNAIPGKLGPFAAAWVLSRRSREPFAAALSSQLVAKLLEMGAVVLLGAGATLLVAGADALGEALVAGAALFVALASAAGAIALLAPRAGARLARRAPRLGAALSALGAGIAGVGSPARLALALVVAFLPALTAAAAYALPLAAFGVPRPAAAGAALVAVITFGQLTPGLPVGTGVYWGLSAWAARHLGARPDDAAALAVLTHAAMVVASLGVGAISALVRRSELRELLRRRADVARAAEATRAAGAARAPPRDAEGARSRTPT